LAIDIAKASGRAPARSSATWSRHGPIVLELPVMENRVLRAAVTALALVVIDMHGWNAAAQPAYAATTVVLSGRVVHGSTGEPVPDATVLLEEQPTFGTQTSADGTFSIRDVPVGTYHVLVLATGFATIRSEVVVSADAVLPDIALRPDLHYTEVVSVSATPRDQFVTYQPTSVLAGQDLAIQLEGSLGAALKNQPGIAERSFGPAASRPVVRGLDGDRVLVLEDGQRTGDLSSQSGDHGVAVNPATAARIEVVRGPAALLHGATGIGGLVNVITEIVPARPVIGVKGSVLVDAGSAATEGGGAADVQWGTGTWALKVGGSGRRSGDFASPAGDVENTQARSALGNIALSRTSANGYLGGSYEYTDMRYGVPIIEEGQVELTPRRHAFTARGERRGMSGFLTGVRGAIAHRRYRQDELRGGEPETKFENDTTEFDFTARQREIGRWKGTFGGWTLVRSFSAVGEEALSPPVDQHAVALFLFEEVTWPHVTVQFGGRYDRSHFSPDAVDLQNRTFNDGSASLGLLARPGERTTIALSLTAASRSPALEELYYFGPHPGNFAFEIGNPDLGPERAVGLDVSFRWRLARTSGEVAFFRNDISDFIFRRPISPADFAERFGDDPEDFPVIEYGAADSVLQGFEAHTDINLTTSLLAEVTFDYVRGDLKDGDQPLPRMPPFRAIAGLRYQAGGLQVGGDVTAVATQDRLFPDETATDGYRLLKLFGAYSFGTGTVVNTITVRLDNATNELYRNHLSLVKDLLPQMGRNVKAIYSVSF
jgi:iron complex outermembrane receptor protein